MVDFRHLRRGAALAQSGRRHAWKTGFCAGQRLWTTHEDALLIRHYPDYDLLEDRLRHRTRDALKHRARCLQLTAAHSCKRWSLQEASRLRKLYNRVDVDLLSAFPGRTKSAIATKAADMRIARRPRLKLVESGFPLTDAIRRRAFELGWTMRDLDAFAGTKRYFQSGGFGSDKHPALLKAIQALAGRLRIEWTDDF